MKYLENFLEKNEDKPFITNLKKYEGLSFYGKCKVVSSLLTHLFIDAELLEADMDENIRLQTEILSILTELTLYKVDSLMEWLSKELED